MYVSYTCVCLCILYLFVVALCKYICMCVTLSGKNGSADWSEYKS